MLRGMLNIGPLELLAIGVVALLVLGPEKLPGAVRSVGRVFGELRRISSGFQNELRDAFEQSELEQEMKAQRDRYEAPTPPDLPDPDIDRPDDDDVETSGHGDDTEPTATEAAASGKDDDPGKDDEGASESPSEQDDSEIPRAGGPAPAGS
jgi:sec-independent protein translocase protein TatB